MSDNTSNGFAEAYDRLASTWYDHETLRHSDDMTITQLGASAMRVHDARAAMWDWWRANRAREAR